MKTETVEMETRGFAGLSLDPRLVKGLSGLGYEEPTAIQQEAIPRLLEGRDLVGQAATGTGKTAAFALPLLHLLAKRRDKAAGPAALVLVPTRELAMQVAEAVHRYGRVLDVAVLPIYGGQSFSVQLRTLRRGVDVVVATPGRALDHLRRGTLSLASVQIVVLDEADEMLDMGFAEDLEAILAEAPEARQTVLFSATIPARITAIAKRHLKDPVHLRIASERTPAGAAPRVRQTVFVVARAQKIAALGRILDLEDPTAALVFCRTRNEVDELGEKLRAQGYRTEVLHGGMSQEQRDRVMTKLRNEAADLVIATDVAARGLDIPQLTHVINYDVPAAPESYVHRIGRVGRAGREGVAITLAEPREHRLMRNIEQLTKCKIESATVPTVADLRARRLELVGASLREVLAGDDVEPFRIVVDALAGDYDSARVAMAAVKLLVAAQGAESNEDIQDFSAPTERRGFDSEGRGPKTRFRERSGGRASRDARYPQAGMTRLFIGGGREMGLRPQDIVGAITGEAGIEGREIGVITICDRFSLVEVADELAEDVIDAMSRWSIRGRKVPVRPERAQADEAPSRPFNDSFRRAAAPKGRVASKGRPKPRKAR